MSLSPIAFAESLRIGTIDFVSPDEIKVLLELDAPDSIALNTGKPSLFPRINGYVLIPSDEGFLVGQVEWITVERSQYPKRKGLQDFGLIDLPYPLRKMKLNPLGCLRYSQEKSGEEGYQFRRGVEAYPTVGDPVLLPTEEQLRAIVESGDERHIKIGISPLAANAAVKIDPDRLFGRHLAVLGNTGSGKSCSVAGLIRWSLEAAEKAAKEAAREAANKAGKDDAEEAAEKTEPNARFIVLDPNGEYANAFKGMSNVRTFAVKVEESATSKPSDSSTESKAKLEQLQVPLWFWNSEEWCAFTQAAPKLQRPTLKRALRELKADDAIPGDDPNRAKVRRYFKLRAGKIRQAIDSDAITGDFKNFGTFLEAFEKDLSNKYAQLTDVSLDNLIEQVRTTRKTRLASFQDKVSNKIVEYYRPFAQSDVDPILLQIAAVLEAIGDSDLPEGPNEDTPREFAGADLVDQIEKLGDEGGVLHMLDSLISRVGLLLSDPRMRGILENEDGISLDGWLSTYFGDDDSNGTITIIDLSLVPSEVVHIITAVIARMTLEALQRYRKMNKEGKVLPTVLVMEEAHTFIKRYKDDSEVQSAAAICCQVFEKIAREGRKFGLGLVLSSQRPSELSPTVLSQCNTFLLHRISNDRDQELVQKLVPDNLRGLLRDLPSLPARHAILLGWASELPTLVQMNELPDAHRPKSDDPDFWAVWSRSAERVVDWEKVAKDWQEYETPSQGEGPENGEDDS